MKKGFTLIELLAVVIIVSILSAVALPQYRRAVNKAKLTEAVTHLNAIQKGIDMYCMQFKSVCMSSTSSCFTCENGPRLDGDVLNSLTYVGAGQSDSKNFTYYAQCQSAHCTVRLTPKFPNVPTLQATRSVTAGLAASAWTKTCTGVDSALCEGLKSQGFN